MQSNEFLACNVGTPVDVYVVFVTAYSDHTVDEMQQALQKNTMLLTKPFQGEVLVQMARTLYISWNREHQRVEAVNQLQYMSRQLEYQANHDQLTGLANRRSFFHALDDVLEGLDDDLNEYAVFYLDLDQFKVVNDTCGHFTGDQLLRELSSELQSVMREGDLLARLGGDEFGILTRQRDHHSARLFGEMILNHINNYRFYYEEMEFSVGASIGVITFAASNQFSRDQLIQFADMACYEAKDRGRNQLFFYIEGDDASEQRMSEMGVVAMVTNAFKEDRFRLYAQPIVPLKLDRSKRASHYEVLIRMVDTSGTMVPPDIFIPASEHYGVMHKLDRWVISKTFELLQRRKQQYPDAAPVILGINLSGTTVMEEDLNEFIYLQMHHYQIDPNNIYFEVTETSAINQLNRAGNFISEMKALGFRFALDDFGSGMSSFSYLKSLPVDFLKIDGQFVVGLVENKIDRAMVEAMQSVSLVMGMESIAEYVENEKIATDLSEIGVNYAQGYLFDQPKPLEQLFKVEWTSSS